MLLPTEDYTANGGALGAGGDQARHTLGYVNDAGDGDADPFDGNYCLGDAAFLPMTPAGRHGRHDALRRPRRDRQRSSELKFANVGEMGALLCVGPMPSNPVPDGVGRSIGVAPEDGLSGS